MSGDGSHNAKDAPNSIQQKRSMNVKVTDEDHNFSRGLLPRVFAPEKHYTNRNAEVQTPQAMHKMIATLAANAKYAKCQGGRSSCALRENRNTPDHL